MGFWLKCGRELTIYSRADSAAGLSASSGDSVRLRVPAEGEGCEAE